MRLAFPSWERANLRYAHHKYQPGGDGFRCLDQGAAQESEAGRRRAAGMPDSRSSRRLRLTMAIDPVCGMSVDPAKPGATLAYSGKTHYFCCTHCAARFEAEPPK